MLKDYVTHTGSENAEHILEHFRSEIRNFWMVKPKNMKDKTGPSQAVEERQDCFVSF